MSSATTVALSLYLYDATGSPQVLASVVAASMLASIWMSPLVGGLTDHLSKRFVLLVGNSALALLVGVMAAALAGGNPRLWLLYTAILGSGGFDAVIAITQQAAVRDVASNAHLVRAKAVVTLLQSTPLILGPALGAALYAAVSLWHILIADAVSFVLAGCGALALPRVSVMSPTTGWLRVPFAGAREGLGLLWRDRAIRSAQLWYSLANIGNGLASGIVSAWILHSATRPRATLGAFGTDGAVGMVAAAMLLAAVTLPGSRSRWVIVGLLAAACVGVRRSSWPQAWPVSPLLAGLGHSFLKSQGRPCWRCGNKRPRA